MLRQLYAGLGMLLESLPGPIGMGALQGTDTESGLGQGLNWHSGQGLDLYLPPSCLSSYSSVCGPQAPSSQSKKGRVNISLRFSPKFLPSQARWHSSTTSINLETSETTPRPQSTVFHTGGRYPLMSNEINCGISTNIIFNEIEYIRVYHI